jgi:hypothetical protein
MLKWKPWLRAQLMMSRSLAHHPARNMGQCPIELVYDEDLRTLEMLASNNNGRLATPRVKWIEDPAFGVLIPGSMPLLRPIMSHDAHLVISLECKALLIWILS